MIRLLSGHGRQTFQELQRLEHQLSRAVVLYHRLRTSESGRLRHVDGGRGRGDRLRMPFMLPIISRGCARAKATIASCSHLSSLIARHHRVVLVRLAVTLLPVEVLARAQPGPAEHPRGRQLGLGTPGGHEVDHGVPRVGGQDRPRLLRPGRSTPVPGAPGDHHPGPVRAPVRLLLLAPVGRMAEPEEIADIVLVPGLGRRAYITGAALDVNGGLVVV
jgi:hypothetical protein